LLDRKAIQTIWKWIEHLILPKLEHAVTVNYSIATIYRRLYGTRFSVVRNVPERLDIGQRKGNPEGQQLIIYQGSLNVGRGLELIIDAMQFLPEVHMLVAGSGDLARELRKRVAYKQLEDRVEFTGRVMPGDLNKLTMRADLGVSLEEDLGLNYRYALPNKIFDYIQCRVPVLCSALPEMSRIVDSYGVGISTSERDPEKLAGIVRYMLKERAGGAWMGALEKAAHELCWENESKVYLELVKDCRVLD
jgi:glycosyltransferase involved in cell wall biosynthesis